ncbi:MAG: site-2 protease family protein [Acidobacteria bacterium]|nr:site-2 protease family protein [Acidobacteriota bacterium]
MNPADSAGDEQFPLPPSPAGRVRPTTHRLPLHLILFLATLGTTIVAGSLFHVDDSPPSDQWLDIALHPARWLPGIPYALSVLTILLAHELGHYFVCRFYQIPVSLPYFLPGLPILGTFGAFIRIRGSIPSRKALFDVGIAGPLAGFVVALPFILYGMSRSRIVLPSEAGDTEFLLGFPLLFLGILRWFFPHVPEGAVLNLSPYLSAAWVGMLATSLNLLPAGQLDGGHICYAISKRFHARLSRATLVGVILLGALHRAWLVWAVALLFLGERHPPLVDESEPLSPGRRTLAILALVIFLLSFMPVPIELLS